MVYKGKFGNIPADEFFARKTWYEEMFISYGDPRTTDLFLMRTPEVMIAIVCAYLIFVLVAPKMMEKRRPFDLKKLIIVYNFALVALSTFMSFEFFMTAFLKGYNLTCQGVEWDYPTDSVSMRMVRVNWLFFFSKVIELADTVFFILRKKNNQVTFLHVYHHATMIINWWMACKYLPVGQSFFVGMVNSFIHALMYTYYALAALGPQWQKYLWWKKYMTSLQLVQFVLIVSHTGYNKFVRWDCDYPWLFNSITFYYTNSMVILFSEFYYRTYVRGRQRKPQKKSDDAVTNGVHIGRDQENNDINRKKLH